jgi:hypothetical protein
MDETRESRRSGWAIALILLCVLVALALLFWVVGPLVGIVS